MLLGFPLAGLANIAIVAAFIVLVYRMADIQPSPLERRRLRWSLVVTATFAVAYAVLFATQRSAIPFFIAGFLGVVLMATRYLQQRQHWLVTMTADERERLPARRERIAATTRRPAFWLLVAAALLAVAIVNVAAALGSR
jgi:uncharacterized membrane protein